MRKIIAFIFLAFLFYFVFALLSYSQSIIDKIVQSAERQINTAGSVIARGKRFNRDCSGFTSMIFYLNGIDLLKSPVRFARNWNMVASLFDAARARGDLILVNNPQPGDIVFFDRTYDANRNGRADDPFTHVGIVQKVNNLTGNVYYIHRVNPGIGVKKYVMNTRYPNKMYIRFEGKRIKVNDFITRGGLSGAHFRAYVRLRQFSGTTPIHEDEISNQNNRVAVNETTQVQPTEGSDTAQNSVPSETTPIPQSIIKIERYPNGRIFRQYPVLNGTVSGTFIEYFPNGKMRIQAKYIKNKKNGIQIFYYQNGVPYSQTHYVNDIKEGHETFFHINGKPQLTALFKKGKPHGLWTWFDKNGRVIARVVYQNGIRMR